MVTLDSTWWEANMPVISSSCSRTHNEMAFKQLCVIRVKMSSQFTYVHHYPLHVHRHTHSKDSVLPVSSCHGPTSLVLKLRPFQWLAPKVSTHLPLQTRGQQVIIFAFLYELILTTTFGVTTMLTVFCWSGVRVVQCTLLTSRTVLRATEFLLERGGTSLVYLVSVHANIMYNCKQSTHPEGMYWKTLPSAYLLVRGYPSSLW